MRTTNKPEKRPASEADPLRPLDSRCIHLAKVAGDKRLRAETRARALIELSSSKESKLAQAVAAELANESVCDDVLRAATIFVEANKLRQSGRESANPQEVLLKACELFQQAVQLGKQEAFVWREAIVGWSLTALHAGDYQGALQGAEEALGERERLELQSELRLLLIRAQANNNTGHYREALDDASRLISTLTDDMQSHAWGQLSIAYEGLNKHDLAAEARRISLSYDQADFRNQKDDPAAGSRPPQEFDNRLAFAIGSRLDAYVAAREVLACSPTEPIEPPEALVRVLPNSSISMLADSLASESNQMLLSDVSVPLRRLGRCVPK
jgi:hypothetical protein